ncbi:MAG TPA: hypothetical protein ENK08_11960 [Chloroflexi bacterium]|nr:hypothetical protein [Chloroflexota bacterium]
MFRLRLRDSVEPKITGIQVLVIGGGLVAPLLAVVVVLAVPSLREQVGWVLGGLFGAVVVDAVLTGLLTSRTFTLTVEEPVLRVSRRGREVFRCRFDRPFGVRVDVPAGATEEAIVRILLEQDGQRFHFTARVKPEVWRGLPFVVEVDPREEVLEAAGPTVVEGDVAALLGALERARMEAQFLPLWPWEQILQRLWSERQPDVLLGTQAFTHVRLWVGDEENFLVVTDEEVATPWFRWPRETTTAVAQEHLARRGVKHEIALLHGGERFTVETSRWMDWETARAVAHFINGDRPPELREAVADAAG